MHKHCALLSTAVAHCRVRGAVCQLSALRIADQFQFKCAGELNVAFVLPVVAACLSLFLSEVTRVRHRSLARRVINRDCSCLRIALGTNSRGNNTQVCDSARSRVCVCVGKLRIRHMNLWNFYLSNKLDF